MSEVAGRQRTVDLIDPPRSGFGFSLLITPFGDPIGFQIQTRVLRINRAEDFELAKSFCILSALFPISDFLDDGRDQVAALGDPVQPFLEMCFRRVKPECLGQDRYLSVQIRFCLYVTIGLDDVGGKVLPPAFTHVELEGLKQRVLGILIKELVTNGGSTTEVIFTQKLLCLLVSVSNGVVLGADLVVQVLVSQSRFFVRSAAV